MVTGKKGDRANRISDVKGFYKSRMKKITFFLQETKSRRTDRIERPRSG